jgi:hypothetical protein
MKLTKKIQWQLIISLIIFSMVATHVYASPPQTGFILIIDTGGVAPNKEFTIDSNLIGWFKIKESDPFEVYNMNFGEYEFTGQEPTGWNLVKIEAKIEHPEGWTVPGTYSVSGDTIKLTLEDNQHWYLTFYYEKIPCHVIPEFPLGTLAALTAMTSVVLLKWKK